MANVFFAMKRATKMESGVTSTTTSVVQTLTESMKPMVPMIVTTPVNSCEKPIKRAVCKLVNIGNDAGNDVAGFVCVKVRKRQTVNFFKGCLAHIADGVVRDLGCRRHSSATGRAPRSR